MMKDKRVELHLHTRYSAMDALTEVLELIRRAADEGWPAVAITDHGNIQAFPEAQRIAREYGVKVIYGLEAYCFDDTLESVAKTYHVILLAKNKTGLKNLYELVTYSNTLGFERVPRIPRSVLNAHREGLLVGSGCVCGEIFDAVLSKKPPAELDLRAQYYDYLEIQPICNNRFLISDGTLKDDEELRRLNIAIAELAKRLDKPLVATGDVHFLDAGDELARSVLLSARGIENASAPLPLYFKSTEEMLEEFSYLGESAAYAAVLTNPRSIADSIDWLEPVPSDMYLPKIEGADREIRKACKAKAESLYGKPLPAIVKAQLNRELSAISRSKSWVEFSIAEKLVRRAEERGYTVGSRGALAASLVAYLLGITEVNPLCAHYICRECRHSEFESAYPYITGFDIPDKPCPNCAQPMSKEGFNLPMETFFIDGGRKLPDLDLNFATEYQPRAAQQLEEIMGSEQVLKACSVSSISEGQARSFTVNFIADNELRLSEDEIETIVSKLSMVKDRDAARPDTYVIIPEGMSIADFCPLGGCHDARTIHFGYFYLHDCLLSLDILGHGTPSVLRELEDATGTDSRAIPLDDEKTLALLRAADTLALPEFGSDISRQLLKTIKPKSFSELIKISGLSHGTGTWEGNAETLLEGNTASLGELICTRDDIYIYLVNTGMDRTAACKVMEFVRKGKFYTGPDMYQSEARRKRCAKLEEKLRRCNIPDWYIDSMKKIRYLFPKAHVAVSVLLSYRVAWYKAHYPLEYSAVMRIRAEREAAIIGERQ